MQTLIFGPFELQPERRVLLKQGEPLRLSGRAVDLLILLTERAGELISNDKIMKALWPETHVDEANIRVHVTAPRQGVGCISVATLPSASPSHTGQSTFSMITGIRSCIARAVGGEPL
jgi:DNA-binding winged helix-turn-helix (wHTH) protein